MHMNVGFHNYRQRWTWVNISQLTPDDYSCENIHFGIKHIKQVLCYFLYSTELHDYNKKFLYM